MLNRTEKLLGNLSKGLVFVVSAPAGTGKNTLVNMLKNEFPCVVESVSCTTRSPRKGERDGQEYHFLTKQQFDAKIQLGDFLEYAEVFGNYYGTSLEYVLLQQTQGNHVILVIDTQGALQVKKKIDAISIFLVPPSLEILRERLTSRMTENAEEIERRLQIAQKELEMMSHYDYSIVNGDLQIAYEVLRSIIISEEHKMRRNS